MSTSLALAAWPSFAAPEGIGRKLAGAALRGASRVLARLARSARVAGRLAEAGRIAMRQLPPELEFYAEAGAPEGALYIDGCYAGHLPGVTRL